MSKQNVAQVIDRLLTDEDLRERFEFGRIDTIAELHLLGLDLTADEINAFVQSDLRLWSQQDRSVGRRH